MYKTHIVKRAASLPGALLSLREPSAAQRFVLIVCLILLPCANSPGQSPSGQMKLDFPSETRPQTKMITVDDVIRLSKAGLSDDVIIAQIKKRPQPFDLSTDQLIQLKAAHVSDRVIQAMAGDILRAQAPIGESVPTVTTPNTVSQPSRVLPMGDSTKQQRPAEIDNTRERKWQSTIKSRPFDREVLYAICTNRNVLNPSREVERHRASDFSSL